MQGRIVFTFHYVSIKSQTTHKLCLCICYLHSTMYLLNPFLQLYQNHNHQDLHSTMYLLNPFLQLYQNHNHQDLHSTMYLLNQIKHTFTQAHNLIYIPLCIY